MNTTKSALSAASMKIRVANAKVTFREAKAEYRSARDAYKFAKRSLKWARKTLKQAKRLARETEAATAVTPSCAKPGKKPAAKNAAKPKPKGDAIVLKPIFPAAKKKLMPVGGPKEAVAGEPDSAPVSALERTAAVSSPAREASVASQVSALRTPSAPRPARTSQPKLPNGDQAPREEGDRDR